MIIAGHKLSDKELRQCYYALVADYFTDDILRVLESDNIYDQLDGRKQEFVLNDAIEQFADKLLDDVDIYYPGKFAEEYLKDLHDAAAEEEYYNEN